MIYKSSDFRTLVGIDFLSERILKNHFHLYEGYVENTNHLLEHLSKESDEVIFSELKRRFGWEFNGMRLHELYFEGLTQEPKEMDLSGLLHNHISAQFGSFEDWKKDFLRIAAMRGIGWVILYYDKTADKLLNTWINEHDLGHLSGSEPILVLDVFEHAYMVDYDLDKKSYINSFMQFVDWEIAGERLKESMK